MIIAAIHPPSLTAQSLPFNWFDIALAGVLGIAFWRGRNRGMSKELLPTLQWLAVMLGAGFGHPLLAAWLTKNGYIQGLFGTSTNDHLTPLITAYVTISIVVAFLFRVNTQKLATRLEGSNFFGGNEFYWGIVASLIHYASLLIIALALLNAPYYSKEDIQAQKKYNNQWYGGGQKEYSGNLIPSLYDVQNGVFKESMTGPWIKANLSFLLIDSSPAAGGPAHH